jgi:hypothetical protein
MVHKCDTCPKEFKKKISLLRHKEKNECEKYKKLPYGCTHCGKRYALKRTLAIHIKDKHKCQKEKVKTEEFKCYLCNRSFSTKSNLTKHVTKRRCPKLKDSGNNTSVINNTTNNTTNNNNTTNIGRDQINNTINIQINNFNEEKLEDWIKTVSKEKISECLRDLNGLPINLLEVKHVLAKKNRNIYLPSEEDKYKNINVYNNGWKEMKTSFVLGRMLSNIADDIYDIISNASKFKVRMSKKLKKDLDEKITFIQNNKYLQGPTANMLLKNKEVLHDTFEKSEL